MSRILIALAFALLLPATASADLRSPVVGDTSLLSEVPQSRTYEPAIATDGNRTFVAYVEERTGVVVHVIGAAGTEAGAAQMLQEYGSVSVEDPRIAVSGRHVYVAWIQGSHALKERHAVVVASHDGGRTFGRPVRAGRPTGHGAWDLRLAADGDTVFVAYGDNVSRVWTAGSRDGGQSFTCFAVVSEPGDGGRDLDVAVDGEHVFWSWKGVGDDVMVRRSKDAGRTLEPLERVYENGSGAPVLAADGGTVAVVFGQRFRVEDQAETEPRIAVSNDGGSSWQTHAIGSRCVRGYCPEYALDVDAGRVYAAWRAQGQMWLARSETGFAPRAIGPYLATWYPGRPAIDAHGDSVSAVWHNSVSVDNPELDPVAAFSADRGASFALRTVSDAPGFDMLPVTAAWGPEPTGAGFAWWTSNVQDVKFAPMSSAEPDVAVLDVRPFQVTEDAARLAAGRPTTIRTELRSLSPRSRTVPLQIDLAYDENGKRVERSLERRVVVKAGRTTLQLLADLPVEPDAGRITATVTVLPEGHDSDPANNTGEGSRVVVRPRPLKVLFVPVNADDEPQLNCRDAEDVAAGTERYFKAAWPIDPATFGVVTDCAARVEHPAGIDEAGLMADGMLLSRLDRLKFTAKVDKVVGVVPQGWFSRQRIAGFQNVIGIAPMGGGLEAAIVERQNTGGWIVAHELAHNLGQDHRDGTPAPGYWVQEKRDIPDTTLDFLHHNIDGGDVTSPTGRWISQATWDELTTATMEAQSLRRAAPTNIKGSDPFMLALGGSIEDGAVTAGPAFQLDGTPEAASGPYTAELLGADGTVLATQGFGAATDLGEVQTSVGAFSLQLPDLDGARTLRLRRGAEVLHTRTRSSARPAVTVPTPTGAALGEDLKITWEASDADGGTLTSTVALTTDGGQTWRPVGDATTGRELTVELSGIAGDVRVRVTTTDGWNTTTAESGTFTVSGQVRDGLVVVPSVHRMFTVDLEGRGLEQISTFNGHPRWSPDGRRIAFDDMDDLWVIQGDGSGQRKVTSAPSGQQYLFGIWADNRTVVSLKQSNAGVPNVAVDVDTGAETPHPAMGFLCEYSRDGSRLVAGHSGSWTLMRPDGTEPVPVPNASGGTGCLSLSPDGRHGVAESMTWDPNRISDISVWDLRTGERRNLTAGALGRDNGCPRFAPSGEWIVSNSAGDLWKIRPDGTGAKKLLDGAEHDTAWGCADVQPLRSAAPEPGPTLEERDPVAKAAPAAGAEGTPIALDAGGSEPGADDAAITAYGWDVDGDGTFTDATGATPKVTFPDEGTYPVSVLVTDARGRTATATTAVEVSNAAPVISQAEFTATGELTARVADSGAADTLAATVRWGAGEAETVPLIATGDGFRLAAARPGGATQATIAVSDSGGARSEAAATRVVPPANGAPTAADATAQVLPGESTDLVLPATDPEGQRLRYEIVDAPAKGTLQLRAESLVASAPDVTYTATDEEGPVTFTYRVSDGTATSGTATVTLDVKRPHVAEAPPRPPYEPVVAEPARAAREGTRPIDQRMVAQAVAVTAADVLTLPASKACVSKRNFPIRIKRGSYTRVVVHVNGKRVKVRNRTAGVDLRGLPKGRFKVTVAVTLKSGKVVRTTRHFRTCTAGDKTKKKGGRS